MPGARVRARAVALSVVVAPSVTIFGLVVGALLLGAPVLAQPDGPLLLRQPTVSRTQIAFTYAGDIWVVPREGGEARRLTAGQGDAGNPVFSPDGSTIAYSATVDSNRDVYVMPAGGGVARRLTCGFEGLFASRRVLPNVCQWAQSGFGLLANGLPAKRRQLEVDQREGVWRARGVGGEVGRAFPAIP